MASLVLAFLLMADIQKQEPPKPTDLQIETLKRIEAEQQAIDSQIQALNASAKQRQAELALLSAGVKDLQAQRKAKTDEEQKASDETFKAAGISAKDYKIDLSKKQFVKIATPVPVAQK